MIHCSEADVLPLDTASVLAILKERPQLVQISDVVPIQIDQRCLVYLRVVWLEYVRDTTYYRRVLGINDDEIASKVLKDRILVTELSFNERRGYLCHSSALESIEL